MDEREELKQELERELQWVQYRQKMLDIMEGKLVQMKQLAEQVKQGNVTAEELKLLNYSLNDLLKQVKAIDNESRRTEDGKILE